MFRKVLETPWYFDENAYSKNSNNGNAVLTDSISSKYQGDHEYFRKPLEGTAQQPYASCYAELRCAATQSYAVLRRATLSYTEIHEATTCNAARRCTTQSYVALRSATLCHERAMHATLSYAVLLR